MTAPRALDRTAARAEALRLARQGIAPSVSERHVSLYLERCGYLAWAEGGAFRTTPEGDLLLESWTRRPERRTKTTNNPDVAPPTSSSDRAPTEEHPE